LCYPDGCITSCADLAGDLVNIPVKKSGWLNIYPCIDGATLTPCSGTIYRTKEIAGNNASPHCIACVEVSWEE
jgi:hypothetical protein